ncbi:MAG: hypothetical protein JRD39_04475 [Deltaproteobacteria bacterium]|jgi:hypothetical protein|nr:hypothetical protein [Deltaproteobacteria bacterium]
MKNKRTVVARYAGVVCVLMFGVLAIIGSGGGGGGGGDSDYGLTGWVEIDSFSVLRNDPNNVEAYISGSAFISPDYVLHQCIGLGCLINWFDDSYPGVDVYLYNETNFTGRYATSRYGTLTSWKHEWYAYMPLANGTNTIVITAFDGSGIQEKISIIIEN